jgi:hypothetical protein
MGMQLLNVVHIGAYDANGVCEEGFGQIARTRVFHTNNAFYDACLYIR